MLGLLVLALAGCTPQTPAKGTLEVLVGAPPGVNLSPNLSVVGPDGTTSITTLGKTTLTNLTPGEYTLEPGEVIAENGYSYRAGSSKVVVEAGATVLANVNYQASTGKLSVNVTVNPGVAGFVPSVEVRNASNVPVASVNAVGVSTLNLPPGAYTIAAGTPPSNYRVNQATQSVVVTAGQERTVNIAFGLGFGTIAVTVQGPPGISGFVPDVNVTGPGGTTAINTAGQTTLTNQVVGLYTVSASNVGPINGVTYRPTITVSPAAANPFTLDNEATQNVSIGYVATGASVAVTLQNLAASDSLTLTLRAGSASGPVIGTRTVTSSSPQPIRFDNLPFTSIHASATGVRRGTYLDSYLISDAPSVTTTTDNPSASVTVTLSVRPFSGHFFVGGNGSLNNSGWTISASGGPPYDIPGLVRDADAAWAAADANFSSGILPSPRNLTTSSPTANFLRGAGVYGMEFDSGGNLYVIYQFVSAGNGNRIVRVGRENLEENRWAEGSNSGSVSYTNYVVDNSVIQNNASGSRVTDLAFDSEGNLWFVNEPGGVINCINRAQFSGSNASISRPASVLDAAGANLRNPRAIAFDSAGNLWVTGGTFPGIPPYLARIPATQMTCPSTPLTPLNPPGGPAYPTYAVTRITPDIRLRINPLSGQPGGPIYAPTGMALSPDGQSLWIADYGAGSDSYSSASTCNPPSSGGGSITISASRESVIKVPLSGNNADIGERDAYIIARITVGSETVSAPGEQDRGMQQATSLAFDSRGNLWVATNNNVEIDPARSCFASTGISEESIGAGPISRLQTDRRGKIYIFEPSSLVDTNNTLLTPRVPRVTLSSPTPGVGFTGLALNIPPIAP
ncbi:two-component regulator propeller domain-containing protein [Meiothermus sp.]|uniref:two-component regulator propeller domain-containing protein n=1 Tax=Meiothermus sp. TaxID=1955249 RepID=UPI00307F1E01